MRASNADIGAYEFGVFRLDLIERCLLRDGTPVLLPPKVFDTLRVLVEQGGRLVEKARIMREVWADTFVAGANVTQNIFTLRRILGERETGQRFIETVPRRGYRFVAPVREVRSSSSPRKYTSNTEAYYLYLKGRFFWNKRTERGLKKAVECFLQTLELDPTYALAYAGLADCYLMLCEYGVWGLRVYGPKGKAAAIRALELDESLGEAHASLGLVTMLYDWNFAAAENEFKRAIELAPTYATAHQWYALNLALSGRLEEAFSRIERARELDPLSLIIGVNVARIQYFARQYEEALRCCREILELDPDFGVAYKIMGLTYEQKGLFDEAIRVFHQALDLLGETPEMIGLLAHMYAISGKREAAQTLVKQLQEQATQHQFGTFGLVLAYTGLREFEQAFFCLEKSHKERCDSLPYLTIMPHFDCLRADPRFIEFVQRSGLAHS